MDVEFSGTRDELRSEVRAALGGVDDKFIKDSVVDVNADRVVRPFIDDNIDVNNHDQDDIDNAIIFYTADRAFNSPQLKSTVSGGGLTTNYSVEQYRRELRQRTSEALSRIGLAPPSNGPIPFSTKTDGFLR